MSDGRGREAKGPWANSDVWAKWKGREWPRMSDNQTTHRETLASEKRSQHIYFLKKNLLHAISKLWYALSHVVNKVYVVCIANQEIRPCVLKVVAYKRLKTMENYKTVSTKSGRGNLR